MNRLNCIFLLSVVFLNGQEYEHKHHIHAPKPSHRSRTPDIHLTIDIPPRSSTPDFALQQHERDEVNVKKLKIKTAAVTAIVTALISAGVALAIHFSGNNCS